jgi:hypothetical protein
VNTDNTAPGTGIPGRGTTSNGSSDTTIVGASDQPAQALAIPNTGALTIADAMAAETQMARMLVQIEAFDILEEYRARFAALAEYAAHHDQTVQAHLLGAARRIEARIGQLLGDPTDYIGGRGKKTSVHAQRFESRLRSEFRLLARWADRLTDNEWRQSHRALVGMLLAREQAAQARANPVSTEVDAEVDDTDEDDDVDVDDEEDEDEDEDDDAPVPVRLCNWCGKTEHQVHTLIAGPNSIFICDKCVELCDEVLIERGAPTAMSIHPADQIAGWLARLLKQIHFGKLTPAQVVERMTVDKFGDVPDEQIETMVQWLRKFAEGWYQWRAG